MKTTHSVLKAVGIVLGIVFLLVLVGMLFAYRAISSMGLGSGGVADYDTRIVIWENAAGNSSHSKLDDMNIDYNGNKVLSTIQFGTKIVNSDYKDVERAVDTFTYLYEIKGGFEEETYEDEPYLIPYVCEGSDAAVIVIPGGGFGYKSTDGTTGEGKDIALTLNENGISAFVLHYRSNPSEYPIPYLDVQRAVRYLRFYCDDFHLDPDKISLIGFSAGGNEIGTFINVIQGKNFFPEGYVPDEIDFADDGVATAAMIYPALSFRYNIPMLFCMFDDEDVRDGKKREELLEKTDLWRHISSQAIPQFIAYGTKDGMVGVDETKNYIKHAKESGCNITVIEVEGDGHGFAQPCYMKEYVSWLKTQ